MSEYDNSNRLALWQNDKREKATHPHLRGSGETDKPVWVSAWFSQDISDEDKKVLQGVLSRYDSKKPFISISIQDKDGQSKPASNNFDDDLDSIPF
jgi:hypothetical protein